MGRKENDLPFERWVPSVNYPDYVAGGPILFPLTKKIEFAGNVLDIAAAVYHRGDAHAAQLRGKVHRRDQFIMCAGAAALESVTGQKIHFGVNSISNLIAILALGSGGKNK